MASTALSEFQAGLSMANELLKLEGAYKDPPLEAERRVVEGLRGGAAVLMVAVFEGFIKDVTTEYLTALKASKVVLTSLPAPLQIFNTFATLELAMKGNSYDEPKRTGREARLPDVLVACATIANGSLKPEVFGASGGNPSAKVIKKVFSNIAIHNIFALIRQRFERAWGAPVAERFIPDKLDEIVNRRHVIAHTGAVLNVSRAQVGEASRFLGVLAETIDESLAAHITKLVAAAQRA